VLVREAPKPLVVQLRRLAEVADTCRSKLEFR
jgi:hypothetical protein